VRDVTFTEDASQVRSGTAPQVMACLRNLAIDVLCRAGPVNLTAALRFHSRDPHRPLATLGISLGVGIPEQPGDLMDYCLEERASGLTRMLAGR
jgi:hypothetical protein